MGCGIVGRDTPSGLLCIFQFELQIGGRWDILECKQWQIAQGERPKLETTGQWLGMTTKTKLSTREVLLFILKREHGFTCCLYFQDQMKRVASVSCL